MADRQASSADDRQLPGYSVPAPPAGDVRALLAAMLDEPDLSAAVHAVDAVVRDYLRDAGRRTAGGSWPSVRLAAGRGVPAIVLERSLWQAHLRLVDGLLGADTAGTANAAAVRALTSFTVECCEGLTSTYPAPAAGRDAQDRGRLLRRVLAGGDVEGDEAERVLGVRCSDHHWAAVLWSARPGGLEVEDLIRFALAAARSVGGARPLIAVDGGSEVWMWTRWQRAPTPETIAAACSRLRFPDGLRVSSGPVVPGLSGFRRSLLGARATRQTVGAAPGARWNHYAEVHRVSLLTGDREQAEWFVEEVLGGLGRNDPWHATLRETLRLYLARGRSRQQVAAVLYINRNTVAYRVQKAAELLGRPIDEDTFDLRLALEIARVTGSRKERPA